MQTVEQFVVTYAVNSLWQATLVVLVAACCARLMRNTEARYRHAVWVMALVLGVIVPLARPGISGENQPPSIDRNTPAQVSSSVSTESANVRQAGTQALANSGTTLPSLRFARALGRVKRPISLPALLVHTILAFYLLSLLIHCFRLARAIIRTIQIRASAEEHACPEWMASIVSRCQNAFGLRSIRILHSPTAVGPITVGARRPVIILPNNLFHPSAVDDLTAALCHEMAHIRRHDFILNLVYEVLYLPASFHPAVHLARHRINETRELACDEMTAGRVLDASTYARSLLSIATNMSRLASPASARGAGHSLGVFDADILEERIMRLLNRTPQVSPGLATASVILAASVLAGSVLGAATFSLGFNQEEQSSEISGGVSRVVRTGEKPQQDGSISGIVHDPSGAVIPRASVMLTNTKTQHIIARRSGEDGTFEFAAIPAGQYRLEITKLGFAPNSADLELKPSSVLHQDVTLNVGEVTQQVLVHGHKSVESLPTPPQPTAPQHKPRRIRVGGQVETAKQIFAPRPVYTASAQEQGIEGTVVLRAVIGTSGQILSLSPKSGPDPGLITSAMDALRQWRYTPTLLNGEPVEVVTTIEVVFQLDE